MKKLLLLALLVTFTLGLSSCVTTPDPDPDPECTGDQVLVDGVCEDPTPDPDTTAPVLAGVEDATIFLDATFDPLAGVTAIDAVDGDITADIVVAGTVDTSSEGVTYLLYTSTDAAGNATQASRYITVEVDPSTIGDELIPNGDFSMGTALWAFDGGGVEGGIGSYAVTDGVMAVTIGTAGWGGWEPRMRNEGLTFTNGVTYEISFKAKADAARSIKVDAAELLTAAPWTTQFAPTEIFDLTTEWATYSFKVTMVEDTNTNGSLLFQHGAFDDATAVGAEANLNTVVYYDDIVMEVSTPDPDVAAPVISGVDDVTVVLADGFDPLQGVSFYDVDMTLTNDDFVITHDGGTDVTMETDGTYSFAAVGDYVFTYTLTDADSNVATETRTVTVSETPIPLSVEPLVVYGSYAVADEVVTYTNAGGFDWGNNAQQVMSGFDGTKESITISFTGVATHNYKFKIENTGVASTEIDVEATGSLQEVVLDLSGLTEEQRAGLNVLVIWCLDAVDGTLDFAGWEYSSTLSVEPLVVYGSYAVADEVVTYTNAGGFDWGNNAQQVIAGFDGTEDSITISFTGVATHNYKFKIENTGVASNEVDVEATGSLQEVVLDLSGLTEEQRAGLNVLVIWCLDAVDGTLDFDGWVYSPEAAPVPLSVEPLVGINAYTVTDEVITYANAAGGHVWDNNAQQVIAGFDGTEDSITISFTGVATHNYKFKIENTGVGSQEVDVEATGSLQEVVLDLSALTEAQRDGLNVLVIWCLDAVDGTLDFDGWVYSPEAAPVPLSVDPLVVYGSYAVAAEVVTYTNAGGFDWGNNAQQVIAGFDGTEDSITISFTGVATHNYKFKIENTGVGSQEVDVEATGSLQEVVLDLSALTEAQRDGLNVLVIWCLDAVDGTLDFDGWVYTPAS